MKKNDIIENIASNALEALPNVTLVKDNFKNALKKQLTVFTVAFLKKYQKQITKKLLYIYMQNLNVGSAIGIICGMSISSVNTQSSLNSFHNLNQNSETDSNFIELINCSKLTTFNITFPSNENFEVLENILQKYKYKSFSNLIERITNLSGNELLHFNDYCIDSKRIDRTLTKVVYLKQKKLIKWQVDKSEIQIAIKKLYCDCVVNVECGIILVPTTDTISEIVYKMYSNKAYLGKKDILDFNIMADGRCTLFVTNCFVPFKYDLPFEYDFDTNNMHLILEYYGIEMARYKLLEKMNKAIKIQSHHTDVLSNFITRKGDLKSINRFGIDKTNVLQAACFEENVSNFLNASINKTKEEKKSLTSQVILMNNIRIGTNYFDILQSNKNVSKFCNI